MRQGASVVTTVECKFFLKTTGTQLCNTFSCYYSEVQIIFDLMCFTLLQTPIVTFYTYLIYHKKSLLLCNFLPAITNPSISHASDYI